jgi:hypothetical protein
VGEGWSECVCGVWQYARRCLQVMSIILSSALEQWLAHMTAYELFEFKNNNIVVARKKLSSSPQAVVHEGC